MSPRRKKTPAKTAQIEFADVTLRDGHQSQWGTMMLIDDLVAVAPHLARVGFSSYEVFGGATTHIAILKKGENPFVNLEKIREVMPEAMLSMLLRGQNGVGYKYYADDVIRHFVQQASEFARMGATYEGVNIFRIFDAHNYLPNIRIAMEEVIALKKAGKNVNAQGTICFSISENPYLDVEDLVRLGHQMAEMGAHSLCVKDMAGRVIPEQADPLIRGLAKTGLPIAWHSHTTFGSQAATLAAMRAAIDVKAKLRIDTCLFGLSGGYSHIDAEALIEVMKQDEVLKDYIPDIDIEALHAAQEVLLKLVDKYSSYELAHDPDMIKAMKNAQVPGGMITNLIRNVSDQTGMSKKDDGFGSVLMQAIDEFAAVREDVGYPSVVTPSSQYVGTQAVFNVMEQRRVEHALAKVQSEMGQMAHEAALQSAQEAARYTGTMVPTFAEMALGHHGRLPGPVRNRVLELARKKTRLKRIQYAGEDPGEETYRAAETLPPGLPDAEQILQNHNIDSSTPDGQKMLALAAHFPNDFDKIVTPVDPRKEMQPYPQAVELPRVSENECAALGDVVDTVGGPGVISEFVRRIGELTRFKDGTYEDLADSGFAVFEMVKISAQWQDMMQKLKDTYHGALWIGVCTALKDYIGKEIRKRGFDESIFKELQNRLGKLDQEGNN